MVSTPPRSSGPSAAHPAAWACPGLRPADIGALFDPLDPFPSPTSRLSPAAAARFLTLAKAAPPGAPVRLRLEADPGGDPVALEQALRRAFAFGAADEARALSELFRNGRRALVIGLTTLSICLTLGVHGAELAPGLAPPKIVTEGLKLIGWVAMWKPMEVFLYDWLPVQRRRRLYARLATAEIAVPPPAAT